MTQSFPGHTQFIQVMPVTTSTFRQRTLRPLASALIGALRTPKLSVVMSAVFVCLTIPILLFLLIYNYHKNLEAIESARLRATEKTIQTSIENSENFIAPIGIALRLIASMAQADPAYFRTDSSAELLYSALISAEQIDAVYVSFEDGYHRVVTRMDKDRRRSDPQIPPNANWHSSYIDGFALGKDRARHRKFFDTWGHFVGGYSVPSNLDIRTLEGYPETKQTRALVITEPGINPDTGAPLLFVRYPITRNGEFIGAVSANITMNVLSRFLANHLASINSKSVIVDPANRKVIAASTAEDSVQMIGNKLTIAILDNVKDSDLSAAYRARHTNDQSNVLFESPKSGDEMSATFAKFPESFGKPWEITILTPTNDFVGDLKATNRHMILVIIGLTMLELLLIYAVSIRLTRPIEGLSRDLKSVEEMMFEGQPAHASKIREIAQLQSAAALLRNSLRSFASYVPLDLVRNLVKSGVPPALGVEQKRLTIFFSDLEDFSSHAERLAPDDLLHQVSSYFEQVSDAIVQEQGTVDKFIGDGVMAFWGAPIPRADHALRGCAGALRAARRMEQLNGRWKQEGRPTIRIRVGLHSADVLVGNVGSKERFSYTVTGDGVNVASRLEGINKVFNTTICISDSVVEAAGPNLVVRPLRKVQVKGKSREFMIYELLGLRDSTDPELCARAQDVELSSLTWEASRHFQAEILRKPRGAIR